MLPQLIIKSGREKPVLKRHPWIYSGAVARSPENAVDGGVVDVVAANGLWLGRGMFNSRSQIVVRLLTWNREEEIDRHFWQGRIKRAFSGRAMIAADVNTTAYRLVNADSDGLPGLIIDRYGDWLVTQFLGQGAEHWQKETIETIQTEARGIYNRSDAEIRTKEGLLPVTGVLAGEEPPDLVEITEHGLRFLVDMKQGHKTGFYLDQRDNRRRVAPYLVGREVLNSFAYTGAFGIYALAAGAKGVTHLESSAAALELARRHDVLNPSSDRTAPVEYIRGDVFAELRRFRNEGRTFDAVILDPPKFATSDNQLKRACRGYQDINRLAMNILRPGGVLITFSCSGLVTPDLFQKIIFSASLEADREVQILEKLGQANDHPILLTLPETEYLKGLVCRVW